MYLALICDQFSNSVWICVLYVHYYNWGAWGLRTYVMYVDWTSYNNSKSSDVHILCCVT